MKKQEEISMMQELENFHTEIEALVRAETFKADRNANEHRAPQSYRDDMQGYSRGVSIWGHQVINMIRERFCAEKKV